MSLFWNPELVPVTTGLLPVRDRYNAEFFLKKFSTSAGKLDFHNDIVKVEITKKKKNSETAFKQIVQLGTFVKGCHCPPVFFLIVSRLLNMSRKYVEHMGQDVFSFTSCSAPAPSVSE